MRASSTNCPGVEDGVRASSENWVSEYVGVLGVFVADDELVR